MKPGNAGGGKGPWFKTTQEVAKDKEIGPCLYAPSPSDSKVQLASVNGRLGLVFDTVPDVHNLNPYLPPPEQRKKIARTVARARWRPAKGAAALTLNRGKFFHRQMLGCMNLELLYSDLPIEQSTTRFACRSKGAES